MAFQRSCVQVFLLSGEALEYKIEMEKMKEFD